MAKRWKMTPEEEDRKHEKQFEKAMYEAFREDSSGVHFNLPLEHNLPLQVFNEVMQKKARRKVN